MKSGITRQMLFELDKEVKYSGSILASERIRHINKLVEDNAELAKALTEAISFIGYHASVEDIKERCYAALADAGHTFGE